jgi:enolase-phosphatase E1
MINTIVTDIEGTTSSLSFVKDVLFPYARERMAGFVQAHRHDADVAKLLAEVGKDAGRPLNDTETLDQLLRWIDEDRKITCLKALQGMIWEQGYRQGDFKGHVYDDAARNLRRWRARGLLLYVYSSGSVYAQKLLFAHSDAGDLTPLFAGYFDTTVGMKRDAASYARIVQAIARPASQILFLSDIKAELDAAASSGMRTGWLIREGALPAMATHFPARDFDAIDAHFLAA